MFRRCSANSHRRSQMRFAAWAQLGRYVSTLTDAIRNDRAPLGRDFSTFGCRPCEKLQRLQMRFATFQLRSSELFRCSQMRFAMIGRRSGGISRRSQKRFATFGRRSTNACVFEKFACLQFSRTSFEISILLPLSLTKKPKLVSEKCTAHASFKHLRLCMSTRSLSDFV